MDLALDDRVFIVTGGSKGLGFASAQALVNEGAKVVIASRSQESLNDSAAALNAPDQVVAIACDLADEATAERLTAAAAARFGRLDGCVISSGGPAAGSVLNTDDEQWRQAFDEVMLGTLRLVRGVSSTIHHDPADLNGKGGSIVIVLSTSVRTPLPGLAISNALRPGLAAMIKDLADGLGQRGVRVNGLMPGRFATDRVFALDAREGSPERTRTKNEANIPLGRYGEPTEFGALAAFLCSPIASYVNGSVIAVDGGSLRAV